jgi:hypothetical protein
MTDTILSTENLKKLILGLKISPDQEKFLLDNLPQMDEKERIKLLETLKNVYLLNEEEKQAMEKVKSNWE